MAVVYPLMDLKLLLMEQKEQEVSYLRFGGLKGIQFLGKAPIFKKFPFAHVHLSVEEA